MYEDTVVSFSHPDRVSIEDPLTAVLRSGARRLLAEAVEAEVEAPLVAYVGESHSVAALACQREPTTGTASVGDYELREFFDACVLLCYVSNDPAMGHDDEAITHAKSMMNVMGHDNTGESLVAQSEYI